MKKIIASICTIAICAISVISLLKCNSRANESFFESNIQALAAGEVHVTTCLGWWGKCTLPNGTESLAPAVEVSK